MNGDTVAMIEAGRLEFSALMSRGCRLADVEPVWSEPATVPAAAEAEAPAAAAAEVVPTAQAPRRAPRAVGKGKTRAAARSFAGGAPVAAEDWF